MNTHTSQPRNEQVSPELARHPVFRKLQAALADVLAQQRRLDGRVLDLQLNTQRKSDGQAEPR